MAKIKPSTYIIDPIFPTREIHMLAGASGSGKSTLMAQIAEQFLKGEDVFGYAPNPIKGVAYLAFDRSIGGMGRTFERTLQTDDTPFPFYSTIDSPEFKKPEWRTPVGAVKHLHELHPNVDVLIVDGIGIAYKGDSAKLSEVAGFIQDLVRALSEMDTDLTIFAIHHVSKQKKGNEYAQARAKLHGSVGWAATCETIILIEPEDEDDQTNPNRILTLSFRNTPPVQYTYCFDEYGRLIPGAKLLDPANEKKRAFKEIIGHLSEGRYPKSQLRECAQTLAVSGPTFDRWLREVVEEGILLVKVGHGIYARSSIIVN